MAIKFSTLHTNKQYKSKLFKQFLINSYLQLFYLIILITLKAQNDPIESYKV